MSNRLLLSMLLIFIVLANKLLWGVALYLCFSAESQWSEFLRMILVFIFVI